MKQSMNRPEWVPKDAGKEKLFFIKKDRNNYIFS